MAGSVQQAGERTATELNYTASGQNARVNSFVDAINRKVIIPLLEKTAATYANFMMGTSKISTISEGKPVVLEITPDVREGNFIYKYSDRKTSLARENKYREIQKTISEFSKIQSVAQKINWQECFKYALLSLGVENTSKFLIDDTQISGGVQNEVQTP